MKIIVDQKTGKKKTVFQKYEIEQDAKSCPHCNRVFKKLDLYRLSVKEDFNCCKCGSKFNIK